MAACYIYIYLYLNSYPLRSGDLDASCNDFAKAISIQPNNVDFIHNYGNCLRKFEKYEEAAAVYLKAIQLLPKGV